CRAQSRACVTSCVICRVDVYSCLASGPRSPKGLGMDLSRIGRFSSHCCFGIVIPDWELNDSGLAPEERHCASGIRACHSPCRRASTLTHHVGIGGLERSLRRLSRSGEERRWYFWCV